MLENFFNLVSNLDKIHELPILKNKKNSISSSNSLPSLWYLHSINIYLVYILNLNIYVSCTGGDSTVQSG